MDRNDLVAVSPLVVLAVTAVLLLVLAAVRRHRGVALGLAALGPVVSLATIPAALELAPRTVTPLLRVDPLGLAGIALLTFGGLAVVAMSVSWLRSVDEPAEEYLSLVLLATTGAAVLAVARHLVTIFLGIEVLGVALYGLIAYARRRDAGLEAALKYLILAGASSAFLLFGVALLYAAGGRLDLPGVVQTLATAEGTMTLPAAGLAMLLTGLGFKLALVPFHLWTPDVYEGAPAPVAALVASVSKGGVALALLRLMGAGTDGAPVAMTVTLGVLAAASMLSGNLLALRQDRLERLLAYSSIAHLGYLTVALLGSGDEAARAGIVYVVTYVVTILAAFGLVGVIGDGSAGTPVDRCRGLLWRRPWVGTGLLIVMLSLAGMPLTAGFTGKVFALDSAVGATRWTLALLLVATSVIGLFYYLRVVVALFARSEETPSVGVAAVAWPTRIALAALVAIVVWFGAWPSPLLETLRRAVDALG